MSTYDWDFSAPTPSDLGDHDVPRTSDRLAGRRIALLVTGGIAAMLAPLVARALRRHGATVVAFASADALRYVGRDALEWATCGPVIDRLTWRAEHLSDAAPFDAYLVAPATYNTIGKTASGIADSVVTAALASALGRLERGQTQVLVAPTMHGSMHHAILVEQARKLADRGVRLIAPRDAYGKHNLPDPALLCAAVGRALSTSPLRGARCVVSAGPLVDRGTAIGRVDPALGLALAEELTWRGADVTLLRGVGVVPPETPMPTRPTPTVSEHDQAVAELGAGANVVAVFARGPQGRVPGLGQRLGAHRVVLGVDRDIAVTEIGAALMVGPTALTTAAGTEPLPGDAAADATRIAEILEGD